MAAVVQLPESGAIYRPVLWLAILIEVALVLFLISSGGWMPVRLLACQELDYLRNHAFLCQWFFLVLIAIVVLQVASLIVISRLIYRHGVSELMIKNRTEELQGLPLTRRQPLHHGYIRMPIGHRRHTRFGASATLMGLGTLALGGWLFASLGRGYDSEVPANFTAGAIIILLSVLLWLALLLVEMRARPSGDLG